MCPYPSIMFHVVPIRLWRPLLSWLSSSKVPYRPYHILMVPYRIMSPYIRANCIRCLLLLSQSECTPICVIIPIREYPNQYPTVEQQFIFICHFLFPLAYRIICLPPCLLPTIYSYLSICLSLYTPCLSCLSICLYIPSQLSCLNYHISYLKLSYSVDSLQSNLQLGVAVIL